MQKLKDNFPFHFLLMVLAVFLSVTTVVLASIPLFLLRASAGRALYLVYSTLLCLALAMTWEISFVGPIAVMILLVAVFEEARQVTCSQFQAGLASILSVTGISSFVLSMMIQFQGLDLIAYTRDKVEILLGSVKEMQPDLVINTDKILMQLPSAIIMIFMISLWLGLIGSSYIANKYKGLSKYVNPSDLKALKAFKGYQFKVPGNLIWFAIPVLAIAFIDFQNESLSIVGNNLLNLFVVVYFFHGLAVIAYFFKANEVGSFWQWFWYIILVIHMFLLVSSVGFADYWMDFRSKIRKYLAKAGQGSIK